MAEDVILQLRAQIAELESRLAARDRYIAELRDAIAALMDPTYAPSQKPLSDGFVSFAAEKPL